MARINTYQVDNDIGTNDIVIGSEYGGVTSTGIPIYKTKNYRMSDLLEFFGGGNFQSEAPISIETLPAGNKNWVHDPQSLTSTPSSVTLYAKDNYAENTPETFASVTGVTTNTTGHLTGYVLTTFTMPEEYSFNVIGDAGVDHSGSGSVDSQSQTINFEQTLTISGGDAWISTLSLDSAADKVSIYHNDVSRTDVNNTSITLEHDSVFKAVSPTGSGLSYQEAILSDAKGHLLGEKITQYTLPDYKFNIAADSANSSSPAFTTVIDIHSTSIDTLSILASAPISSIITADDTITISHDEVSALIVTPAATDAPSFGGNFIALKSVDRNATGHLTHSIPVTVTIPNTLFTGPSGGNAGTIGLVPAPGTADGSKFLKGNGDWATIPETYNFFIDADGNSNPVSNKEITDGETLSILGGANLNSNASANNTITINHDTFSTTTSTHAQSPGSPGFGGNFTVLSGLTVSNGHVTDKESIQINMPSLPTYDGDDIDIDTGALSGATVISDLNFNITTNTYGHVTDANDAVSTRELTLADLGYTGATDANNYVLPTDLAGDDIDIGGTALTGANVISDVDINITTNSSGLVTDANGSVSTRVLALADLGYTGATDANNYTFPYTISQAASNSTVVRRHDSGYIFANYFNTTPNTVTSGVTQVCVETGNDGYIRHGTAAAVRSFINVADGANNITNNNQISNGRGFITGYTEVDTLASITGRTNGNFTTNDIHVGGAASALTNARFSVHGSGWSSFSCNSATKATPQAAGIHLGWNHSGGSQESEIKFGGLYSHTHKKLDIISLGVNNAETTVMRLQTSGISCGVSGSYINITASNFTVSSDIRLKSNIKPIKDGINVLKQFTSYEYIKDDKKEAGFIAQEVKKAIPYSVVEDEENYLTMNDRAVLAHMHKAILELEERLTAIEEKLN